MCVPCPIFLMVCCSCCCGPVESSFPFSKFTPWLRPPALSSSTAASRPPRRLRALLSARYICRRRRRLRKHASNSNKSKAATIRELISARLKLRKTEVENNLQIPIIVPAIAPPPRCLSSVRLWLDCNDELVMSAPELVTVPVRETAWMVLPPPVGEPECDPPCDPVCVHMLAVLVLVDVLLCCPLFA